MWTVPAGFDLDGNLGDFLVDLRAADADGALAFFRRGQGGERRLARFEHFLGLGRQHLAGDFALLAAQLVEEILGNFDKFIAFARAAAVCFGRFEPFDECSVRRTELLHRHRELPAIVGSQHDIAVLHGDEVGRDREFAGLVRPGPRLARDDRGPCDQNEYERDQSPASVPLHRLRPPWLNRCRTGGTMPEVILR